MCAQRKKKIEMATNNLKLDFAQTKNLANKPANIFIAFSDRKSREQRAKEEILSLKNFSCVTRSEVGGGGGKSFC